MNRFLDQSGIAQANSTPPSRRNRRTGFAALLISTLVFALPTASALAGLGDCGQPTTDGTRPRASDALAILVGAVTPPNLCPPGTGAFDA
jgi:broad specificity phosphatase PhoE